MASYEYELTIDELKRLLFYKKVCPYCRNRLKKQPKNEFIEKGWHKIGLGTYAYGKQYRREIIYHCASCERIVKLMELKSNRQLKQQ